MESSNNPDQVSEAMKIEISYCSRFGRYRPNSSRPISVTFQRREDKEQLLMNRRNLLPGVNEEYPIQIKRARDRLRPVFKMIKSKPNFKDKCKLQGDKLVVDGTKYTVDTLGNLPLELAAYQAAEKRDDKALVFHGEWSPCSNFHPSPFTIDGIEFKSVEHYKQYEKSLLFRDSVMANNILKSETPLDAKRLRYNISEFNIQRWINEGYDLCVKGIREKFLQNAPLKEMLKGTSSLILAEASKDKTWGTGVALRDPKVLCISKWENKGWLSKILINIQEEVQT